MAVKSILIAPDSFKGGISSARFCETVADELTKYAPGVAVRSLPISDGGEGMLECLKLAVGGRLYETEVCAPYGDKTPARILFTAGEDASTAVVEISQCVGLPLVKGRENPERTTTCGIGELVRYAVGLGAENVTFSLGGSCTNDCGAGMLSALGVRFLNTFGEAFVPTGETLSGVTRIKTDGEFDKYRKIRFTAMCDVENPLYGEYGCSNVFARQKGADEAMIKRLEAGVKSFAGVCAEYFGEDLSAESGAGAAGGLGFACRAFLGAELKSGIQTVLDLCGFDRFAAEAELVITGEGSFDEQSLMGKATGGVIARAAPTPVAFLCGCYKPGGAIKYPNLKYIIPINQNQPLEYAIAHTPQNLRAGVQALLKKLKEI